VHETNMLLHKAQLCCCFCDCGGGRRSALYERGQQAAGSRENLRVARGDVFGLEEALDPDPRCVGEHLPRSRPRPRPRQPGGSSRIL
jgi:hypothetical protein